MKIDDSIEGYSLRIEEFPPELSEVHLSRIRTQALQKGQHFYNCPFHKHSSTWPSYQSSGYLRHSANLLPLGAQTEVQRAEDRKEKRSSNPRTPSHPWACFNVGFPSLTSWIAWFLGTQESGMNWKSHWKQAGETTSDVIEDRKEFQSQSWDQYKHHWSHLVQSSLPQGSLCYTKVLSAKTVICVIQRRKISMLNG